MALIYRYEIADTILRDRVDLIEYSNVITQTIKNHFNIVLKDCTVYAKYYEFKLYISLSDNEKRQFGKILMQENTHLKQIFEHKKGNANFRRMKQSYYAFIGTENDDIELIDAMDFQNSASLVDKSKAYISSLSTESENSIFSTSDALNISFYMDTFSLVLDEENEIKDSIELHLQILDDVINIIHNPVLEKDINFEVHNVGQALCTSLSSLDKSALLFFDFGISERTYNNISVLIKQHPPIFLSHLHRDHWNGITVFTEAYKSKWYIPSQNLKVQFRKKCAEIIFIGGNVVLMTKENNLGFGKIIPFSGSKTLHLHETGTILYLELFDNDNNKKNILVAGDQIYSCIDSKYKENIDILVASHHGGVYYAKEKSDNYKEIPLGKDESIIIYSANNTPRYHHPSHQSDYIDQQWKKQHTTYLDGSFKLK